MSFSVSCSGDRRPSSRSPLPDPAKSVEAEVLFPFRADSFEMELRTGNIRAIAPVLTLLPPSGGPGVHLGYMVPLPPAKNQMNQPWEGACK